MSNLEKIQAYGCLDIYLRNFIRSGWYNFNHTCRSINKNNSLNNGGDFAWESATQPAAYWEIFHNTIDGVTKSIYPDVLITHPNPITKRFNAIQKEI